MSTRAIPLRAFVVLLTAGAGIIGAIGPAAADETITAPSIAQSSTSDVTGAIDAHASTFTAVTPAGPAASLVSAARMRFLDIRATMERDFRLREATRPVDVTAMASSMKGLFDDLKAIEAMDQARFAASAIEAARLADDWYQTGLKVLVPPAEGATELPVSMIVARKGDAAVAALDTLLETASALASANPNVSASLDPTLPLLASAPKATATPRRRHHAARRVMMVRAPQPMSQNEASLRLLRESLPLFLPIPGQAIYFSRQHSAKAQ